MNISRREFLSGAAAFGLGGWRLFAAPPGWKPHSNPNIVFGVLADTHLRISRSGGYDGRNWPDKYLVAALEHFRAQNVDAVVHCGDMADRGVIAEMQFHADAWRKVFPDGCAADGRKVKKLFVNGNHDVDGGDYGKGFRLEQIWPDPEERAKHLLSSDMAGNWERIWGEKYEPVWHKEVKGYHFFGMNWGSQESELKDLIDEQCGACGLEDGTKPFFFITHDWTHGKFNVGMKHYRNAFGLWGHWHQSAANWNTIHLLADSIPSVQCPAAYPFFDDGKWLGGGDKWISKAPLEGKLAGGRWRQGLVVRVYDDMLTIERREFSEGGSLGADWVMPFNWGTGNGEWGTGKHPFSKDELKKVIGEPQFRDGAKLEVSLDRIDKINKIGKTATDNPVNPVNPVQENSATPQLRVRIPLANGNPDSRVYAYEVEVTGDEGAPKLHKAVYATGCNMGIGHEPNNGVTTLEIPKSELPPGKTLTFAVRPLTSLGTSGKTLVAAFSRQQILRNTPLRIARGF